MKSSKELSLMLGHGLEQIIEYSELTKFGYFIFGLSIVSVFHYSSAVILETYASDLNTISNCSVPFTQCPTARNLLKFREKCINKFEDDHCPMNSTYLCGVVGGYIIETCQVTKECPPGRYFNFAVENATVFLECQPCPDGEFETEYTKTSGSSHIQGCTYRHIQQDNISLNLVLYENGTKATPTLYHCRTEKGYYNQYGNKFCNDIRTHPCNCIYRHCQTGHQLHPAGICVRCRKKLRPENDWRCEDHILDNTSTRKRIYNGSTTTEVPLNNHTVIGRIRSGNLSDSVEAVSNRNITRATEKPADDQTDSYQLYLILGITAGLLIAALLLFLTCKYRMTKGYCASGDNHEIHVHANNFQWGENSLMINTTVPDAMDLPSPNNQLASARKVISEAIPDDLKLKKLESWPLLQDDEDRERTKKKEVV